MAVNKLPARPWSNISVPSENVLEKGEVIIIKRRCQLIVVDNTYRMSSNWKQCFKKSNLPIPEVSHATIVFVRQVMNCKCAKRYHW